VKIVPCKKSPPRVHLLITVLVTIAMTCFTAGTPSESVAQAYKTVSGSASVNDIELYYEIHGEGVPLFVLHGGLGHIGHWENQIPVLSRHFRVVAVDSRGHGRSTMTEQPISYALMASDVVALMDYLDIERAHVLGMSDGGNIGLHLAINYSNRLIKVIASGANYNPSGVRPDVGEHPKMLDYFGKAAADYTALSPDPTKWEAFLGNISQMWASEPNFTVEQLGGITVPILLLDGENEEFIFPEHTKEMADLIPTAMPVLVPATGHFGIWENPEAINDAILEFLTE
jgi:pimeloyl-ACP methyl ester carboxylesterase